MNRRKDILDREQEIQLWISENRSKAWMCKQLECRAVTLERYLKQLNISYSGNKGGKSYKTTNYVSAMYYINNNIPIGSHRLKLKLLKEHIKEYQCELCKNTKWLDKKIPLELHHIDGKPYNNSLDNLMLLCANCHALQNNNSGKNTKTYRRRLVALAELEYATGLDPVSSECEFKSHRRHQKRTLKHSIEEIIKLKKLGKVDSLGRIGDRILTENEWEERKNTIITCGVDLTKYGWKSMVERVTTLTKRQISNTIKHYKEFFDKNSFNRN